jgi:deoxyadenosine/deoxycytidine kinase
MLVHCTRKLFVVYLDARPEICLERIRARNRLEERSIDLQYLEQLHHRHTEWLSSETLLAQTRVLSIDANQSKEHVYQEANTHLLHIAQC